MKKTLLGVKIDDISLIEAKSQVLDWLKESKKRYIVTPNPEILVAAQEDPDFSQILNTADLAIPDGSGLKLSGVIKNTTPGTDLMEELIKSANDLGFTIALLGGIDKVADKLKDCLLDQYPKLQVTFSNSGGEISPQGDSKTKIDLPKTDILFVAFGHIKQEKWISKNLNSQPIKIMMGVGGAFDYLSGQTPRAPKFLRAIGLEWVFRGIIQPWRFFRFLSLIEYLFLLATKKQN